MKFSNLTFLRTQLSKLFRGISQSLKEVFAPLEVLITWLKRKIIFRREGSRRDPYVEEPPRKQHQQTEADDGDHDDVSESNFPETFWGLDVTLNFPDLKVEISAKGDLTYFSGHSMVILVEMYPYSGVSVRVDAHLNGVMEFQSSPQGKDVDLHKVGKHVVKSLRQADGIRFDFIGTDSVNRSLYDVQLRSSFNEKPPQWSNLNQNVLSVFKKEATK